MSINYPCIYHKDGYCTRDSEQLDACVFGPCDDETPSNADRIRVMTDEELLEFMIKTVGNAVLCKALGAEPKFLTLEWLQQPAKEG